MSHSRIDVVVIGGGIAGTALAAHLAHHKRVIVVEMEDQPGYHSTGRSAAVFAEVYGNDIIRSLTRASRDFFFHPHADFSEERLVVPRQIMVVGRAEQQAAFDAFVEQELPAPDLELIDAGAALARCPALRAEGLLGAIVSTGSADIEVHALHQGYIRQLKKSGGQIVVNAPVNGITYDPSTREWQIETSGGNFTAPIVINAAGAWADEVAIMAGLAPMGLEPRRRTAALVDVPQELDAHAWPMIVDAEEQFYMKPDAGLLLISPADETLSVAEDAQPDEIDVAIAADRLEKLTTVSVRHIKSKWAGLRTFAPDRSPIVGYDPVRTGFFWLAALGGYGIQTAPALSALAAKLVLGEPTDADFAALSFDPADISPARFERRVVCGGGDAPLEPATVSDVI